MRFGARLRKFSRHLLLAGGAALVLIGIAEMSRVPLVYLRAAISQHSAASKPLVHIQVAATPRAQTVSYHVNALYPAAAPTGVQPERGTLIGHLTIPKLGLNAPVTQGTALSILAHSAGHLETSVLPGELGTTVIAAHDVTYFHHIDELKNGDIITVQTAQGTFTYKVTDHKVVHVGTNVQNTVYPSLVLETCYPLNALNLVNQRYVVSAVLIRSTMAHSQAAHH
ncbi:class D sortase [Alicyclobacillus curvatus]|nr:class D sortase [Alicyclobacillus curvatus]